MKIFNTSDSLVTNSRLANVLAVIRDDKTNFNDNWVLRFKYRGVEMLGYFATCGNLNDRYWESSSICADSIGACVLINTDSIYILYDTIQDFHACITEGT